VQVELPVGTGAGPVSIGKAGGTPGQDAGRAGAEDEDDPELVAYNAYLARLNEQVKGHGRWHGLR